MASKRPRTTKAPIRGPRRPRPATVLGHSNGSRAALPESSATAVALEALRTGVLPRTTRLRRVEIPHDESILVGDPDDRTMLNEYVGEDTPGGSTPTPDQNDVDEIGRVYGLQEEDSGELRTSHELLRKRDRHRAELRR